MTELETLTAILQYIKVINFVVGGILGTLFLIYFDMTSRK